MRLPKSFQVLKVLKTLLLNEFDMLRTLLSNKKLMTNHHQNIPKFNNILQYVNNMFYIIRHIVTFLIGLLDLNNLINKEVAECLHYTIDNIPYGSVMFLQYIKRVAIVIVSFHYMRCVVTTLKLLNWLLSLRSVFY